MHRGVSLTEQAERCPYMSSNVLTCPRRSCRLVLRRQSMCSKRRPPRPSSRCPAVASGVCVVVAPLPRLAPLEHVRLLYKDALAMLPPNRAIRRKQVRTGRLSHSVGVYCRSATHKAAWWGAAGRSVESQQIHRPTDAFTRSAPNCGIDGSGARPGADDAA
jgi:hypothetical protein